MDTYQRNRGYASVPEPEYCDLEIRCTWSGEYDEFVNVKISLEVIADWIPRLSACYAHKCFGSNRSNVSPIRNYNC